MNENELETYNLIDDLIKKLKLDAKDIRELCEVSGVEYLDFEMYLKKKKGLLTRKLERYSTTYNN